MPSPLNFPAPSKCLLRFLRAQSEGVSFFAPSHGRNCLSRKPVNPKSKNLSTSRPRRHAANTILEAGMLDLESTISSSVRKLRSQATAQPLGLPPPAKNAGSQRYSSSRQSRRVPWKPTWREWLFGQSFKSAEPLKYDDLSMHLDDDISGSIFPRRSLTAKAALDPRLRCTEVDENGEVIMVDGEFKKSELIAKFGLLPRDLRKIDSSNLPHIVVRPTALLVNLLHLKVLIKHDRVLLFDIYGSKTSFPQSAFMYELQGKLQQKQSHGANGLPYEFRALEAVLMSVTSELEADFEAVREPVVRVLSELEDDIERDKLRILLVLSKRVNTFEQKAMLVRNAIEEVLEVDADLSAMYLTEKAHDLKRGEDDHTEVEMLLESYHKICDEVYQEANNLAMAIRNTEEIIRAILDANRNSLMLLDLKFSVGTLGLAMGTFLAGLYGMNLENFIEETNWGFAGVTVVSTFFSLVVCWYGLVKLRKVQRVKIGASDMHMRNNSHWFREDDMLLNSNSRERLERINLTKAPKLPSPRRWF